MPGDSVTVEFDVTNTGDMAGDEVVQLYVHDCLSSLTVYEKMLRGFERIHLAPGQTRRLSMKLGPRLPCPCWTGIWTGLWNRAISI